MTIHTTFKEQVSLAQTYAQDGAFRTSARVLRELSDTLTEHADWCDGEMTQRARPEAIEQFIERVTSLARQHSPRTYIERYRYNRIGCTVRRTAGVRGKRYRVEWSLNGKRIARVDLIHEFPTMPHNA